MIIIEDIIRKHDKQNKFERRQENMMNNTIVIVVPDFSEREDDISETVERIWESFDLEEKLYVLEKAGYPLI